MKALLFSSDRGMACPANSISTSRFEIQFSLTGHSVQLAAEKNCPSLSRNVETREGEWGSVQSQQALLSPLTQQAWDSEKSDMSDKAVTVYEGASWDAPDEFLYVIIFKNYERTNMFAEARLLSCFHTPWVTATPGLRLAPLEAFWELYVIECLSFVCLSSWGGTRHRGRWALSISPLASHCFFQQIPGTGEAFRPAVLCLVHSLSEMSSKFWGLTLPLLPLCVAQRAPSPVERKYPTSLPNFHLIPHQLYDGGRQVAPWLFYTVKKVRFRQLRFFQDCRDRTWEK